MHYVLFKFEQIIFVFGIINGFLVIVSRKLLDAFQMIPSGDGIKMTNIIFDSSQNAGRKISFYSPVFFDAGCLDVMKVFVCMSCFCSSMPYSCDHADRFMNED